MTAPLLYTIQDQSFWLTTERGIYWEKESVLILSDLHFGKTGHFRKNGIAVPHAVYKEDLQRMVDLISFFKPQKIIAVGDLFHSTDNLELQLFSKIRSGFSNLNMILVQGNHDVLENSWYQKNDIELVKNNYSLNGIHFVHDPLEIPKKNESFYFSGHLHPAISISGMGKQNLSFPCYYFSENSCILPAFSKFSGMATVKKKKDNRIFAIVENSLIEIKK